MYPRNRFFAKAAACSVAGMLLVTALSPAVGQAAPPRRPTRASKFAMMNRNGDESRAELQRMAGQSTKASRTYANTIEERFQEWLYYFKNDVFSKQAKALAGRVAYPLDGAENFSDGDEPIAVTSPDEFARHFDRIFDDEMRLVFYNAEARSGEEPGTWMLFCLFPWWDEEEGRIYESATIFMFRQAGDGFELYQIVVAG